MFKLSILHLLLFCESDRGLVLGKKFIVDSYITVRCPADHYLFVDSFISVVVNFTGRRTSKDLELQVGVLVFAVKVEILRNVNLCLHLLTVWVCHCMMVLLQVLVLRKKRSIEDVDYDISFTDINQHVVFEDL